MMEPSDSISTWPEKPDKRNNDIEKLGMFGLTYLNLSIDISSSECIWESLWK